MGFSNRSTRVESLQMVFVYIDFHRKIVYFHFPPKGNGSNNKNQLHATTDTIYTNYYPLVYC